MKIIAKVKFNDNVAIVLDEKPQLVYHRIGRAVIYGTDGIFYRVYKYDRPSEKWKAFGGREFELHLEDGEVVKCNGQWWDDGYSIVEKHLGIKLGNVTAQTKDALIKCYVFTGYLADIKAFTEFRNGTDDMIVYPYREYETIICERKQWDRIHKLSRQNESLIKEVKRLARIIEGQNA